MTPRAIVIGFAFAAFICGVCFFNDQVVSQTTLIRCFFPISVYGGLMLLVIVVQPLLRRVSTRLALSGREVAVIVALVLAACYVPGYGLMQTMTPFLMLPHHYERTEPGWKEAGAVEAVPDFMLADPEGAGARRSTASSWGWARGRSTSRRATSRGARGRGRSRSGCR